MGSPGVKASLKYCSTVPQLPSPEGETPHFAYFASFCSKAFLCVFPSGSSLHSQTASQGVDSRESACGAWQLLRIDRPPEELFCPGA